MNARTLHFSFTLLSESIMPVRSAVFLPALSPALLLLAGIGNAADVQFVILSDVHYGYIRSYPVPIPGSSPATNATTSVAVNQLLMTSLNTMSTLTFPADGGVSASAAVGPVDFVAVTGDIANRFQADTQNAVQASTASYADFTANTLNRLTLKDKTNTIARFFLAPGNHDVSNAIGNTKIPVANVDGGAMKELLKVAKPSVTLPTTYDRAYFEAKDTAGAWINKPNYSMDIGGIHFIALTIWPDSGNRKWIDADLASVPLTTPVMLFMHDYPDVDPKHLTSPNNATGLVTDANYEGVASDVIDPSEAPVLTAGATSTNVEQRAFVTWLKTKPNIVAYFHGHSNSNEMWDYKGPDNDITLKCFRIDSPMKGDVTAKDASSYTMMSYAMASVDTVNRLMTVREVRWYPTPVFSNDTTTAANARSPKVANVPVRTIPLNVAAPTFSLAAGTYVGSQTVTISSAAGTTVYYTKDGSTPTLASPVYTTPITVASTSTVKAMAVSTTFASVAPRASSSAYVITTTPDTPAVANDDSKDNGKCGSGVGLITLSSLFLGLWLLARGQKR